MLYSGTACLPGTFADTVRNVYCQDCKEGRFASLPGRSACTDCAAGTRQPSKGKSVCVACAAGFYSGAAALDCERCRESLPIPPLRS